jgi:hypothetical protein
LDYTFSVLPHIKPFEFEGPSNAGDTVQLTCHVTKGDPPLNIAWYFDGKVIAPHMGITTSMFGKRANFLSIQFVRQSHAGRYTCLATNDAGTAAFAADLHVNGAHVLPIFIIFYFRLCQKLSTSLDSILKCFSFTSNLTFYLWGRCRECR